MLNLALNTVKTELESIDINGTPLIEKYGGLIFPLTIAQEIGKTDSGESILKEKTFPVACGVNFSECIGQRKYQELVPNSKYRSIVYWEQTGDAIVNPAQSALYPKGNVVVYDIPARLVVWMNIAKLNINEEAFKQCSIVAPVSLKIQTVLENMKRDFPILDDNYTNAGARFIFGGQERKDVQAIFGRYSYSIMHEMMLFPYDFFALRYTVRLRIPVNCLEAFTLGIPIECVSTIDVNESKILGFSTTEVFGNTTSEVHGY